MSQASPTRYSPFLGVMTALNARYIPKPYASDALNTRYEDGSLAWRRGFRNICGAQRYKSTEMDALKMFDRADGIVDGAVYRTYVTVERYGSDTSNLGRLMTVDTTTGARQKVLRDKGDSQKDDLHLGGATGGTFTITVEGQTTGAINWNDNAATIEAAIEALSTVEAADVAVTGAAGVFHLTWGGQYAGVEIATSMTSSLTGTTTTPVLALMQHARTKSEVTWLQTNGATSGTFDFTFYGQTLSAVPYNVSAGTLKTMLETLSNINTDDVEVAVYGQGFYLSWGGRYLGDNLTTPTIVDNTGGGSGMLCSVVTNGYESTYASDGTSAVPVLADAFWKMLVVQNTVYGFNYVAGDEVPQTSEQTPLWKFTLGDPYSFVAIKPPVAPNDTTQKLAVQFRRQPGSSVLGYKTFNWAALADPGDSVLDETVFTAMATASVVAAAITVSAQGFGTAEVTLASITAGNQNFQYSDCMAFRISKSVSTLKIDPRTVQVYLKDTNGVIAPSATGRTDLDTRVLNASTDADATLDYYVFCRFPPGKTRADWATTKYFGIELNVTAGTGTITISPVKIGGMPGLYAPEKDWQVGYAFVDSATGQKSGIGGSIQIPWQSLQGDLAFPNFNDPAASPAYLGVIPYLTIVGSSETNVDYVDIVMRQQVPVGNKLTKEGFEWGQWRLVDEVAESASFNYTVQTEASTFNQKPPYTYGDMKYDDIMNASLVGGAVQWLFRKNNEFQVRYSAQGDPLNLVKTDNSDLDILDPGEGANYVLSDKTVDECVVGFPMPGGTFILGENGVFAQTGTTPLTMSPVARIPGSTGCCGADAAKLYRTNDGQSAVIYVSRDANTVYMLPAFAVDVQAVNYRPDEYSIDLRGSIRDFLTQGSASVNTDRMELMVDQRGDAVWIVYVDRVLVLRRKSLQDNKRQWEKYRYNLNAIGSSWLKCNFSDDLGLRCMRINGAMDEVEYDSSNDFEPIEPMWTAPDFWVLATQRITFLGSSSATDPNWPTGAAIVSRKTVTGLTAGTTYYARSLGSHVYEIYDTYAHAVDTGSTTGKVQFGNDIGQLSCGRDDQYRTLTLAEGGVDYSAFWTSDEDSALGPNTVRQTDCDRDNLDDCPSISFYGDRTSLAGTRTDEGGTDSTPVTKQFDVGKREMNWPHWLRGRISKVKVTLSENSSPVREMTVWRVPAQRRPNG